MIILLIIESLVCLQHLYFQWIPKAEFHVKRNYQCFVEPEKILSSILFTKDTGIFLDTGNKMEKLLWSTMLLEY